MIILKCGILIIHQEYEFLNQFDEYYYDEFSGLSPIASTELIDDFTSTARKLKEDILQKIANDNNCEFVKLRGKSPYFKNSISTSYKNIGMRQIEKEGGIYDCCSQTENSSEKLNNISTQILKFFIYSEKIKTSEIYKSLNISRNQLLEYITQYSLPLKVNGHYLIKS